jgi:hypothetical protein
MARIKIKFQPFMTDDLTLTFSCFVLFLIKEVKNQDNGKFDVHMSVHRSISLKYNQQGATTPRTIYF